MQITKRTEITVVTHRRVLIQKFDGKSSEYRQYGDRGEVVYHPMRLFLLVAVACFGGFPLMGTTLFSDLSSTSPTYNASTGWGVGQSSPSQPSFTAAMEFTVEGSGSQPVTQIDLGVEQEGLAAVAEDRLLRGNRSTVPKASKR